MTVKQNGIVHRYGRLEADERFRAALEAEARGDDRELDRLVETCSRVVYNQNDVAFTDRVDAAHFLALAVALDLGPRLAKLRMLGAISETLPRAVAIGVDAAVETDAAAEELTPEDVERIVGETLGRAFDKVEARFRAEAAAVLEAFYRLCREEMGLEPETVLKATLGPLYLGLLGLDQLDGAKPDTAQLKEWHAMFARKWRERVAA
jgi:hypothetical protein